jgi:hypothetical protein
VGARVRAGASAGRLAAERLTRPESALCAILSNSTCFNNCGPSLLKAVHVEAGDRGCDNKPNL